MERASRHLCPVVFHADYLCTQGKIILFFYVLQCRLSVLDEGSLVAKLCLPLSLCGDGDMKGPYVFS